MQSSDSLGTIMRAALLLLLTLPACAGCLTHQSLRKNTVSTTATLSDLYYQQILDNLARLSANPSTLPSFSVVNAGTVTVSDQRSVGVSPTYSPTLSVSQQGGGALPILSLLFNPSVSRSVSENWSLAPVTDVDNLRRIRCAFQLLILDGQTTDCDDCRLLLTEFYLGESDRIECWIPRGWYYVGGKKDVPKHACWTAHCGHVHVWVLPEDLEGLTRFTLTVLDLATGKPHAPTKSVVRNFKSDGSLDSIQETTTETDTKALERMRKEKSLRERPREHHAPLVNPGLFFVPR